MNCCNVYALLCTNLQMSEETYSRMVEIENVNRAAGTLQGASSVTEALAVLGANHVGSLASKCY